MSADKTTDDWWVWRRVSAADFIAMPPRERLRAVLDHALWWGGLCFAAQWATKGLLLVLVP